MDWDNLDAQYEALLHLRDGQQQQAQLAAAAPVVHNANVTDSPARAAQSSVAVQAAAGQAAAAVAIDGQRQSLQPRPQSSQSSRRRKSNGASRRTNSDLPQMQLQHMPPQRQPNKLSPSLLPSMPTAAHDGRISNAQPVPQTAGGPSTASGVPAEFEQMMQQQVNSKQQAALYKKQRAREKAERRAEEEARRAEHRAKMKAIQLRAPSSAAASSSPSPNDTPQSSRPVSRQARPSGAVEAAVGSDVVDEPLSASSVSSSSDHRRARSVAVGVQAASHQQPTSMQSASVAPLLSVNSPAVASVEQPSRTRHTPPKHTSAQQRAPSKQPPPAATATSDPSTDTPLPARASSAAPSSSRESIRLLMRAARRQLQQQQQQGSSEPVVEVRVGRPYTAHRDDGSRRSSDSVGGDVRDGLARYASCEFHVVFASAGASHASSPVETRRATVDNRDGLVEWPQ